MSEAIHMGGCGCPDCTRVAEAVHDNPSLGPAEWNERERKAGRGRFDVRHVGKDREPHASDDPHFRIIDRLAKKPVLTPLRMDTESGRVVGGCDPISGTVGDLVPAIKEMQEGFVYHPMDDRFDLVEDVDQDPRKDQARPRWGIYDRAAGALVVPKNKKGVILSGFKSGGAARRWLGANRRSMAKFSCPTTAKGLKNLKQRIAATSPEGKRAKEIEKARQHAMRLLKAAKRTSQDYQFATDVLKAIETGQPIPERPKIIKPPKVEGGKPGPSPAPAPEPERPRGRIEVGGPEPTNGRRATPPPAPTPAPFRVRAPSEPPPPQPTPAEPTRFRGTVENPDNRSLDVRLKKVENRLGGVERNQEKLTGAVSDLGKGLKRLDDRTSRALKAMGSTKNVMKEFGAGKGESKPKATPKGRTRKAAPKGRGRR